MLGDGFLIIFDVVRDVVSDIHSVDVTVYMVVEETRKRCRVLSKPDLERFGSMGRWVD